MNIRLSDEFKSAYKRLKKKYRSLQSDFEKLMQSLIDNPMQGVEIMPDVRKVRMSISSKGKGKSGGARVIVQVKMVEDELIFAYIYDKSDFENVSDSFLIAVLNRMS